MYEERSENRVGYYLLSCVIFAILHALISMKYTLGGLPTFLLAGFSFAIARGIIAFFARRKEKKERLTYEASPEERAKLIIRQMERKAKAKKVTVWAICFVLLSVGAYTAYTKNPYIVNDIVAYFDPNAVYVTNRMSLVYHTNPECSVLLSSIDNSTQGFPTRIGSSEKHSYRECNTCKAWAYVKPTTKPTTKPTVKPKATAAPLKPYPVYSGKIVIQPSYNCVCPLTIRAPDDTNYYIYLEYIGKPSQTAENRMKAKKTTGSEQDMAFYVGAGMSSTVYVPIGNYNMYYATGKLFYGPKDLFGKNTRYYRAESVFDFYATFKSYMGHTVTLYAVSGGNLETETIPEHMFPTK